MAKENNLSIVFKAIDKVSAPIRNISGNIDELGAQLEKTNRNAFNEFNSKIEQSKEHLAKFGESAKAVGMAIGTALLGAGVTAVASVKHFAEYANGINDVSARLSMNAETLQQWRYVAERTGAEAEDMDDAFKDLQEKMFEATNGNAELADLFKHLNISLKDSKGNMRSSADVMLELADAMKKNEDATVRTKVALELMSDGGVKMLPALIQGREGIHALMEEAKDLNLVLEDTELKKAGTVADAFARMQKSATVASARLGSVFAPASAKLADSFAKIFSTLTQNKQLMDRLSATADKFVNQLIAIDWTSIINGFLDFTSSIVNIINSIGGLKTVAIIIASYIGLTKFVMPLVQAFTALKGALSIVSTVSTVGTSLTAVTGIIGKTVGAISLLTKGMSLARIAVMGLVGATGIGLIVIALGAIATWVYNNWDLVKSWLENIYSYIEPFVNSFIAQIQPIVSTFNFVFTSIYKLITEGFDSAFSYVRATLEPFVNSFTSLLSSISDTVSDVTSSIIDTFTNAFTSVKDFIMGIIDSIVDKIASITETISNTIGAVTNIYDKVTNSVGGAFDDVKSFLGFGSDKEKENIEPKHQQQAPSLQANSIANAKANPTTTLQGALDVNIQTEKGTTATAKQISGNMPIQTTGNTGTIRPKRQQFRHMLTFEDDDDE